MVEKEIIKEAVEMVKDIPITDEPSGVLTPLEITEEKVLAPYPTIEYDVLFDGTLNKLIRNVNTRLGQGWQTEGGIQIVHSNAGTRFYQTLIRWNVTSVEDLSTIKNENVDGENGEEIL